MALTQLIANQIPDHKFVYVRFISPSFCAQLTIYSATRTDTTHSSAGNDYGLQLSIPFTFAQAKKGKRPDSVLSSMQNI